MAATNFGSLRRGAMIFSGDRRISPLGKAVAWSMFGAGVITVAVVAMSGVSAGLQPDVEVHRVDQSPEQIREFWTEQRDQATYVDPMPNRSVE
jgi:hypothetical protein